MMLLIAEDEVYAREGLKQLVPPELAEVQTAANGQEALALAMASRPDVVLCDVRMPKMNGIELAHRLREAYPDVHIMFISAYSDKEYLKSAISIHADGYLEKPVDEGELLDYLRSVSGQIQARDRLEKNRSGFADLFARQQLLFALLRREEAQEKALAVNPTLTKAVFDAGHYLPVSLRVQWPGNSVTAQYTFYNEVELSGLLNDISPNHLFATLSDSQLGVLFYGSSLPSADECCRRMQPILEAIRAQNPQALNVCACLGKPCASWGELYERYHAAHLHVRWMGFAGSQPCAVSQLPDRFRPLEDRSAEFESLLKNRQPAAAKQLVREQTAQIIQGASGSIEQTRRYYELLLGICLRLNGSGGTRSARNSAEILSTFSKLRTAPELARFICVRIDDIVPPISLGVKSSGTLQDVQTFILDNLSDTALSVQSIAAHVGLSENYLSALFKRETGVNLHRAIIDLRIDRAKYLLLNGYRLAEVAARCGFSSPAYFHSVFKKQTGLSPAAFIEKHRADGVPGGSADGA